VTVNTVVICKAIDRTFYYRSMQNDRASLDLIKPNGSEATVVQVPPVAFNLKDATSYTGLSAWSLRVAHYAGELPAKRIGKALLFTRAALDGFIFSAKDAEATNPSWLAKRRSRTRSTSNDTKGGKGQ
jgi:hypothetical protein